MSNRLDGIQARRLPRRIQRCDGRYRETGDNDQRNIQRPRVDRQVIDEIYRRVERNQAQAVDG